MCQILQKRNVIRERGKSRFSVCRWRLSCLCNKRWHKFPISPFSHHHHHHSSWEEFITFLSSCPSTTPSWKGWLVLHYFFFPPLLRNYSAFSLPPNQPSISCGWLTSAACRRRVTPGIWCRLVLEGWAGFFFLSTGTLKLLGKKHRAEREIEVTPAPASEADSWEISG